MTRSKLFVPLCALMLVMGAFLFTVPTYAADDTAIATENLTVDAVWLEGETLNIEVTDKQTGINQTLEVPLSEYAGNAEFVSVQAVDKSGNISNTIQFKNPFYNPESEADPTATETPDVSTPPADSESAVPDGVNAFTPDGSGTVVDNVTEEDGKEFFSVETPDGNVFYLVVDRQRNSDNVYLLNAVTENDLASLAKPGDGISTSGVSAETPPATTEPPTTPVSPEPEPTEPPAEEGGGLGGGTIIFVLIAVAVVGGVGYYFKILRPKQQAAQRDDEDYGDDPDDDGDYDDPDDSDITGEGGDER